MEHKSGERDVSHHERKQIEKQVRENLKNIGVQPYELAYYEGKICDGMSLLGVERDLKKQRTLQKNQWKRKKYGETFCAPHARESNDEDEELD